MKIDEAIAAENKILMAELYRANDLKNQYEIEASHWCEVARTTRFQVRMDVLAEFKKLRWRDLRDLIPQVDDRMNRYANCSYTLGALLLLQSLWILLNGFK